MARLAIVDKRSGVVINTIVGSRDFSDKNPEHSIVESDTAEIGSRFDGQTFHLAAQPDRRYLVSYTRGKLEAARLTFEEYELYHLHTLLIKLREKEAKFAALDAEESRLVGRVETGDLATTEQIDRATGGR